jgi:phage virion morphogenesis protein
MTISLRMETSDLDEALVRLQPIFDFDTAEVTPAIAALGESQTRRRIAEEKTSPDGEAWAENLEGTSILRKTGRNLLDSIASTYEADAAEWGAAWEYAHVHQFGAVIEPKNADALSFSIGGQFIRAKKVTIPARPFVGLSDDNRQEMIDLVTDFLGLGGLQ